MEKERNCSLGAISPLSTTFCYLMLYFYVKRKTRLSLRDKQLFEIIGVEITRVDLSASVHHEHNPKSLIFGPTDKGAPAAQ